VYFCCENERGGPVPIANQGGKKGMSEGRRGKRGKTLQGKKTPGGGEKKGERGLLCYSLTRIQKGGRGKGGGGGTDILQPRKEEKKKGKKRTPFAPKKGKYSKERKKKEGGESFPSGGKGDSRGKKIRMRRRGSSPYRKKGGKRKLTNKLI